MNESYQIIAVNPGSTSTKVAVFDNNVKRFSINVPHPVEELRRVDHKAPTPKLLCKIPGDHWPQISRVLAPWPLTAMQIHQLVNLEDILSTRRKLLFDMQLSWAGNMRILTL